MFPQARMVVTIVFAFLISVQADVALTESRFRVNLTGIVVDSNLRLSGIAYFGFFERRGSINGHLDDGTKCDGSAKLNIIFSRGIGSIQCENGLFLKFKFSVTSIIPISGQGSGIFQTAQKEQLNALLKFRYRSPSSFKVVVSLLKKPASDEY